MDRILIVDCLTAGAGKRVFTRDFIGAGPKYIARFIEKITNNKILTSICRGEQIVDSTYSPKIDLSKFPILFISAMTMDEHLVSKVLRKWTQKFPEKQNRLSVIGGPITSDPTLLTRLPADYAVIGEGEDSLWTIFSDFRKFINSILYNKKISDLRWQSVAAPQIPNINYILERKVHTTHCDRSQAKLLFSESSGYPRKIKFYADFHSARIFVECLRGCSNFRRNSLESATGNQCADQPCNVCREEKFTPLLNCPAEISPGCGFCSTINEFGAPKSRNIDAIVREITSLIKLGARRIVLGAPDILDLHRGQSVEGALINPNYPEPNYAILEEFVDSLLAIPAISNHDVQLFIENIKAGLCTDRALDILARIPHPIFSIGCETGSDKFAEIIGRPGTPSMTYSAVTRAMERNIRAHIYFIHSLPGDTVEYAEETLLLLKKFADLRVEKITLYQYQELPGAPFYHIPREYTRFSKATLKVFKRIKKFIISYNRSQKTQLVGKTVKVFLSEVNTTHPSDAIGWILEGGPKVSVLNAVLQIGEVHEVHITRVVSDRLVLGEIVRPRKFRK